MVEVIFHRVGTDAEDDGDFVVGLAFAEPVVDFAFAGREGTQAIFGVADGPNGRGDQLRGGGRKSGEVVDADDTEAAAFREDGRDLARDAVDGVVDGVEVGFDVTGKGALDGNVIPSAELALGVAGDGIELRVAAGAVPVGDETAGGVVTGGVAELGISSVKGVGFPHAPDAIGGRVPVEDGAEDGKVGLALEYAEGVQVREGRGEAGGGARFVGSSHGWMVSRMRAEAAMAIRRCRRRWSV